MAKKILAVVVAFFVGFGLLAGCSSGVPAEEAAERNACKYMRAAPVGTQFSEIFDGMEAFFPDDEPEEDGKYELLIDIYSAKQRLKNGGDGKSSYLAMGAYCASTYGPEEDW
jgi:hypothetical protein